MPRCRRGIQCCCTVSAALLAVLACSVFEAYLIYVDTTHAVAYLNSPASAFAMSELAQQLGSSPSSRLHPLLPEKLSDHPRLWRVPGYLSAQECDFLLRTYGKHAVAPMPTLLQRIVGRTGVREIQLAGGAMGSNKVMGIESMGSVDTEEEASVLHEAKAAADASNNADTAWASYLSSRRRWLRWMSRQHPVPSGILHSLIDLLPGFLPPLRSVGSEMGTAGLRFHELPHFTLARYDEGGHFTPHYDSNGYDGSNAHPVTMMIYVEAPEQGGNTSFPAALPFPVEVAPRQGDLLVWFNCFDGSGDADKTSLHSGRPVGRAVGGGGATTTNARVDRRMGQHTGCGRGGADGATGSLELLRTFGYQTTGLPFDQIGNLVTFAEHERGF